VHRRYRTIEDKRRIVEETQVGGATQRNANQHKSTDGSQRSILTWLLKLCRQS
jgi:hypothetical protein